MTDQLMQTLEANAGRNDGEAIASYGRSIVFLPKGVQAGENVRVILKEVKEDSRGRMMYRGVPAQDEYSENWKDNGDGTGSRVTIATDWKGNRSEVGVVETRPYQKREGSPSTQSNLKVFWGNDLTDSIIEDSQIRLIPLEEEKVENSQLVWRKYSERQEPQTSVNYPVKGIETDNWCDWYRNRLVANYDPNLAVKITLKFNKPDSSWDQSTSLSATWVEMPKWWQAEQEAKFPVCACGRNRYDLKNSDGYAKCEKCREEEHCIRCGKQAKVKNLSGRLVCTDCESYEAQEQMVDRLVPNEKRQSLAEEAKRMLKGEAIQREAGEIILKSTVSHIEDSWSRDNIVSKYSGYAWYYFCEDGIYGSKLSATTLQIIAFLPQASGNGLVELVAWLSGYQKVEDCEHYGDFYHRTQVKGENQKPSLSEGNLSQLQVAIRLRGSEADRLKALEGYKSLAEKLGESDPRVEEIKNILFSKIEQDYSLALQKINEAGKLLDLQKQGQVLLRFEAWHRRGGAANLGDGWVIRPDGSLRERDSDTVPFRKSDGTYYWNVVGAEELALKYSKGNSSCPHEFHVVKLPVGGVTPEQKNAVREIENNIGVPGGFGIDKDVCREREQLVEAIQKWLAKCPLCGREAYFQNGISYADLTTGSHGAIFCHCGYNRKSVSKIFGKYIARVETYDKWGEWNVAVFVSTGTETEAQTNENSSDDTAMAQAMRKAGLLK